MLLQSQNLRQVQILSRHRLCSDQKKLENVLHTFKKPAINKQADLTNQMNLKHVLQNWKKPAFNKETDLI